MKWCVRRKKIKRLKKMINDKSWECLMADERCELSGKDPKVIYKQRWRLEKMLNRIKPK